MKKILLILSFTSFFNSFGQSIEIDYNQDAIKKLKEEPVLFLNNFEDQKLIGFICQDIEQPIEAKLLVKVYSEKGIWKEAASESFKIFPWKYFLSWKHF